MKISKIKISKFHQFEDFELDLTYPKGHEKEGEALDKVCFIGQSGTGKTTLLEMIQHTCFRLESSVADNRDVPIIVFKQNEGFDFSFNSEKENFKISIGPNGATGGGTTMPSIDTLLYFPSGISSLLFKNSIPENAPSKLEEPDSQYGKKMHLNALKLNTSTLEKIWSEYYEKIKEYKNKSINIRLKYFEEKEGNEKYKHWVKDNPNPTEYVAKECLDILLNKFNLAIKTEIDDVGEKDILPIKSISENKIIPYDNLSTGTKQIIYTAFPIYQLLEENSIVLMDEPETSLYPDIQREIIPYYTSFDKEKKSQFFFATHSPIIASSFEPWEIVELKFDEKGKIYRDIYYDGENHVDNYKIDARYLRWDDILTKVFDLPVEGNMDFRAKKLTEYAILKNKIKRWRESGELENPTEYIKQDIEKFEKAYNLITANWAVTRHEENK